MKDLVSKFKVSRITIQRDLTMLEDSGLITKVHGGAKAVRHDSTIFETRFGVRYRQNFSYKTQIAKKALPFVKPRSTIFIDSSTTAHIFGIEVFRHSIHDLVIVTNAPSLLHEAIKYPDFKIVSTGGELLRSFSMYAGEWVSDFLETITIDSAFISAAGISENLKITTEHHGLSNTLQKVIRNSSEVNLLLDSSKLFRQGMIAFAEISDITRIITDDSISDEKKNFLLHSGIKII